MEKIKLAEEGGTMVIPDTTQPIRRDALLTSTPRGGDTKEKQTPDFTLFRVSYAAWTDIIREERREDPPKGRGKNRRERRRECSHTQ